jgi:hypothetical protein
MQATGLSSTIIVEKIRASTCEFDTSPASLEQLKAAGVTEPVILAMIGAVHDGDSSKSPHAPREESSSEVKVAKDKVKDRERVYDAPFDRVWTACVQSASEKYTVTFSNKPDGVISFEQGMSWKTNSWGMKVGVTVVPLGETKTKVILNPQKKQSQLSWAGGDITKKFFAAVEKALKQ